MKKLLFFASFLCVLFYSMVMANHSYGIDFMGPQEPAPFAVFSTIAADSPERGQAAVSITGEKSGKPDFFRFSTQLSLGITNSISLSANIPYVDNSYSGIEDIAITLKHRLFDEGQYGPAMAYLLTGSVESSTEEISTDGGVGLGIISSKRIGPVNGHLNLIYRFPGDDRLKDEVRFSVGVEFSAAHNFEILGEIFSRKSHFSKDFDEIEARFGYRVRYSDGIYTTLGAGIGLDNRTPDFRVMVSLSLKFPHREIIEKVYEEEE
jgi:hypothetical protein